MRLSDRLWKKRVVYIAIWIVSGCAASEESAGVDEETRSSEVSEALRGLVEHGSLAFDSWLPVEFTPSAPAHAWTFELTQAAAITLRTEASSEGDVDTVLSLYRQGPRGFGRAIARSDDVSGSVLSSVSKRLNAGIYRVVVRGYDASALGSFILASECRGPGCPQRAPECLFGSSFHDLLHGEVTNMELLKEEQITEVSQLADALSRRQLVLAVQQSSHSDVTTAEEALSRVDQQTVRRLGLRDRAGGRTYTALEYGAGDNSYGAIFAEGTEEIAASIHDGDFLQCTPAAPADCLLPGSYSALRDSTAFQAGARALLTRRSIPRLSSVQQMQLLATLRLNYAEADAPTLESAIERVDRGQVNQLRFRHRESGRELVVYEHGAGDTSVGAVFEGDAPAVQAILSDGAFVACRLLGEPAR